MISRLFGKPKSLAERGEDAAAKHLKKHGYKILDRNLWLGDNEIDIVAQQDDLVAFVEVKTKKTDRFEDPAANVTYAKRKKIIRASRSYIAQRDDPTLYYRYDIIAIVWPDKGRPNIEWIQDAFRDE